MKDNFLTDSFIAAGRPPLGSGIKCTSPHLHPSRAGGASLCKDAGPGEITDEGAARPETHTRASYRSSNLTEIADERELLGLGLWRDPTNACLTENGPAAAPHDSVLGHR